MKKLSLLLLFLLSFTLVGCPPKPDLGENIFERFLEELVEIRAYIEEKDLGAVIDSSNSGLYWYIAEESELRPARQRDGVSVHFKGFIMADSTQFIDTYQLGEPLSFVVGLGEVIDCIDEAVKIIGENGKIYIISPSILAYGETGLGEIVPPNTVVMFEVSLEEIARVP